ncbi:wall-associated receptor kinase 2-like protein [Tanacetum coccineum]
MDDILTCPLEAMWMLRKVILHLMVLMMMLLKPTSAVTVAQALPNCPNECGNITIPYPFGTKEGCYLSKLFQVDCKNLQIWNTTFKLQEIRLDGHIRGLLPMAHRCYNDQRKVTSKSEPRINLSRFPISSIRNMLTAVGCDARADIKTSNAKGSTQTATREELENGVIIIAHMGLLLRKIGNSVCNDVLHGSKKKQVGYRCECAQRYKGNAYLPDSCKEYSSDAAIGAYIIFKRELHLPHKLRGNAGSQESSLEWDIAQSASKSKPALSEKRQVDYKQRLLVHIPTRITIAIDNVGVLTLSSLRALDFFYPLGTPKSHSIFSCYDQ